MNARFFLPASTCLLLATLAGCKSTNKPATQTTDITPPAPTATTTDAAPDSPELVARRAQQYSADLEAAIAKRDAREREERERQAREVSVVPATQPTPAPSAVQWTEPTPVTPVPVTSVPITPVPVAVAPAPVMVTPPPVAPTNVAASNTGAAVVIAPPPAPPVDALEKSLLTRIKENPRDASAQLDWQLLQFVRERPAPDLQTMAGLPEEDREVLSAVLDGLSNFRAGVRNDNNMMLSKKVRPLIDSAERLRSQAELHLSTVQLCTRVDGFGVYEPIDPPRFIAGKESQAVLYTEVANFASQLNDKSKWETKLSHEAVLYTETGLPVSEEKPQTIEDKSRNRRTDFFVVRVVKFPPTLTIGRYLLKVTVTDQQASRVAEATVPVTIVAR